MDQLSAHLDRGWDLVARGDLAGALVSAQKSLEIDADSPEAHNLMGYVRAAEGDAEEALDHYRQAIDLDETFVEAMLNAAEILIHPLKDFEGATQMIDDALDFCQTSDEIADATLLKIDALLHQGDRDRAARIVATLPEGPFENDHVEFLIGRAKFEVGDLDGADPLLRSAAERDPRNAEALYYLGLLLDARGDTHGAAVAFLRAREVDLRSPPPAWSLPSEQFERRVQEAIRRLPANMASKLEGALVVVSDLPGAEAVADGVDPRAEVLVDGLSAEMSEPVSRLFVYQRNVERFAASIADIEEEIVQSIQRELDSLFNATKGNGAATA